MPPGSPAPSSSDPVRVTLSQWMNRDNRQPNPSCVFQLPPHPHPRAGVTPGTTGKRTGDVSATEETHLLGGHSAHIPPLSPDKSPSRRDASLPRRRAPIPSRPLGDVFGCQGASKVPGLGHDRAPPNQRGGRAEARRRPLPIIPPFSPSQLAHPPPLTFPHSPPHGPETQKVCFSWLCAPLRQLRPRPSGWAQRLLSLSLSLPLSFPFLPFFSSNSPL